MESSKAVVALVGTLAVAAYAYAQTADRLKVAEKGAEAKFVFVDPDTGVETTIVIFGSSRTTLDPPQPRGPVNQPFTVIEVTKQAPDGTFLFSANYLSTELTTTFTGTASELTGGKLTGDFLLNVETPTQTVVPASIDLTWTATGESAHEHDNNTLVIPGGVIHTSQIRGLHRQATATGTLTIDGVTYQLSSTDAELQNRNKGEVTVFPGSGS